jgi:phosphoribosyl 1,2-cyclic phosphate phosphodiesterase
MKLTFAGTGAADWDWANMPPGTRGSTATLVNGVCLIDAGPTVPGALRRCGVDLSEISDVVVTHSHYDHFVPQTIAALAAARQGRLEVWATPQTLAKLNDVPCGRREVLPGMRFACSGLEFTALPSNHMTADMTEETLHYLVEADGATLLYALDGAWMLAKAKNLLSKALGGSALDAVVWDATCGPTLNDWRFAEHNDLAMIDAMRKSMLGAELVSPETKHVFNHLARTLWPTDASARATLAAEYGGIIAEDGMSLAM